MALSKSDTLQAHKEKLDHLVDTYRKQSPYDDYTRQYAFETFRPFITGKDISALELGCSDGKMTEMISGCVKNLLVVESSERFIQKASERKIKNVSFLNSLFEEMDLKEKYDFIFATHVLTHIPDLKLFFQKVKNAMKDESLLFVAVPNSRVLSRQLALSMGLLPDLFELTENDKNHGHCRAYDRVRLNRDIEENGLKIISQGGILLKPLADFQMDLLIENKILKKEQIEGLYKLGMEHPDLSGVLYAVCSKK